MKKRMFQTEEKPTTSVKKKPTPQKTAATKPVATPKAAEDTAVMVTANNDNEFGDEKEMAFRKDMYS